MKKNTTFLLSGGAGRIITAIPALEKYARLNPDDDFKVLIHGWHDLYWSHPILQDRTFDINQKGSFELFVKNNNLVSPEPYHRWGYYNQELSLAEAFDEEINNTDDHSDLDKPNLYVSYDESRKMKANLKNIVEQQTKKEKIVVFQPYGSTATIENGCFTDTSGRSMYPEDYVKLASHLSEHVTVVYFGAPDIFEFSKDTYSFNPPGGDLRMYMALINECDYFVGCDSVGQHIARAFNKPGLIVMGSTFEKNVSYPDYFDFYRNNNVKVSYNPIRIGGVDSQLIDRKNDGAMKFDDNQLQEIFTIIGSKVEPKKQVKKSATNKNGKGFAN
tara:strand:- start:577 stop:1566 length:990 start_codon:yes stop_codon:yes gene_type:complete